VGILNTLHTGVNFPITVLAFRTISRSLAALAEMLWTTALPSLTILIPQTGDTAQLSSQAATLCTVSIDATLYTACLQIAASPLRAVSIFKTGATAPRVQMAAAPFAMEIFPTLQTAHQDRVAVQRSTTVCFQAALHTDLLNAIVPFATIFILSAADTAPSLAVRFSFAI